VEAPFWVVFMQTRYASLEHALAEAPQELVAHRERSQRWHADGKLVMAGAFLDRIGEEPVSTMAILRSREDADAFVAGDPFVVSGMVSSFEVRPWADLVDVSRESA
jgi:uncharacterized protein